MSSQKSQKLFIKVKHNISMSSTKEEIVTSALVVIDSQQEELQTLRERQIVLISLACIFFTLHMLF